MDIEKFRTTALAILRTTVGWQSAIARRLDVSPRTVRQWIHDGAAPDWVEGKFAEIIGATDIVAWPRDEWLIGDALGADGRRREYISHLQQPRFVARIVACDEADEPKADDEPADVMSGIVYVIGGDTVLCEIDWVDSVKPGEHVKWLEAAADEIARVGEKIAMRSKN